MDAKKLKKAVGPLVLMIGGGGLGYLGGNLGATAAHDLPSWMMGSLALLYIPLFIVVIAFHEAGHALTGVLNGFDFRMFVVGPFMWEKEGERWKYKWNRNVNVAGGMVICMPTGSEKLRERFMMYAAGGPLASLVLGGLSWLVYWLVNFWVHEPHGIGQLLAYIFLSISLLSLAIFIVTIIPIHAGGFSSDGARILRLMRGGDTGRFEILLIKIISSSTGGTRPAHLNQQELKDAMELANKLQAPFRVYLHSFFHQAAFDRGDWREAEAALLSYVNEADAIPTGIRGSVWLDAAFFYGFVKQDQKQAAFYFDKFKPSAIIPKSQLYATQAVMYALSGENEKAEQMIEKALVEMPNMMDRGTAVALRERFLILKDRLAVKEQVPLVAITER